MSNGTIAAICTVKHLCIHDLINENISQTPAALMQPHIRAVPLLYFTLGTVASPTAQSQKSSVTAQSQKSPPGIFPA